MAKKSNKKKKRAKAKRKAQLEHTKQLRRNRVDPYDEDLRKQKKDCRNYFDHLRTASKEP